MTTRAAAMMLQPAAVSFITLCCTVWSALQSLIYDHGCTWYNIDEPSLFIVQRALLAASLGVNTLVSTTYVSRRATAKIVVYFRIFAIFRHRVKLSKTNK